MKKETYEMKFTNFLITAHIKIGGEEAHSFFCDIPFMKGQVSNQEKGTFYLNSKEWDL